MFGEIIQLAANELASICHENDCERTRRLASMLSQLATQLYDPVGIELEEIKGLFQAYQQTYQLSELRSKDYMAKLDAIASFESQAQQNMQC